MLSAIISSDYLQGLGLQKSFDYSNFKSLVYKTDFNISDHYDFLYHDGFFVLLQNPKEQHLNFCLHLSMLASGKPLFIMIDGCDLQILNSFKEALSCPIFLAPFPYRRIITLYESQRGPFLDISQKYEGDDYVMELDASTRTLIINEKDRIDLKNKEFFILKFLFAHREKIVSKLDLFEYVWGKSLLGSISTVDTHMSKLRKKIKDHVNENPIKTIPCAGYMLK